MKNLTIINQDGILLADSREVAERTDTRHTDLLRKIKGYKEVLDQNAKLRSANFFIESTYRNENNQSYPCYLLTKLGCDMVANKMTGEKGILFTAEYVTEFEKMSNYIKGNTVGYKENFNIELSLLGFTMDKLKINEGSKILMIGDFGKAHNMDTSYLPSYTTEKITKSLSELLKQFNVNMSSIKFNKLLLEKGIIIELERASSKGGIKKFKSIANEEFGKNLLSTSNQKETQPHYYEDKFQELINLVI